MKKNFQRIVAFVMMCILTLSLTSTAALAATENNQAIAEAIASAIADMTQRDELEKLIDLLDQIDDVDLFLEAFNETFTALAPTNENAASMVDIALLIYENMDTSVIYDEQEMVEAMMLLAGDQDIEAKLGMESSTLLAGIKRLNDLFIMMSNRIIASSLGDNKMIFISDSDHAQLSIDEARAAYIINRASVQFDVNVEDVDSIIASMDGLTDYYELLSGPERTALFNYLDSYGFIEVIEEDTTGQDGGGQDTTTGGTGGGAAAATGGGIPAEVDLGELLEEIAEAAPAFADVSTVPWAWTSIRKLNEAGVINGKGDGIFDPDGAIIRAEFAAMIVRLLALEATGESVFTDVLDSDWFASVVRIAADHGYVNGVGEGNYAPKLNVSREQVATIIGRIMIEQGFDPLTEEEIEEILLAKVADQKDIHSWAREGVALCYKYDIAVSTESASGESPLFFYPERAATRAEVAEMLYRITDDVETVVTAANE